MADVGSVSWLLGHQCGLCQGLTRCAVSTPCCSSSACRTCAEQHIKQNSSCWACEGEVEVSALKEKEESKDAIDEIINSLFICAICSDTCHRAVGLSCCPGGAVCRGCGVKHITTHRSCWTCAKENVKSDDLDSDQLIRDALSHNKEEGEHSQEKINRLFQRKITFLKEEIKRKEERESKNQNGEGDESTADDQKEEGEEEMDVVNEEEEEKEEQERKENGSVKKSKHKSASPEKKSSRRDRSGSRDRRRDKKKHKHKDDHRRDEKRKKKHRSRDRHRSKDRSRDRDRSRDKSKDRKDRAKPKSEEDSAEKKDEAAKKENGVGSFAALQKRIKIENEIVEKKVKERIEEYIATMVTQQLRVRKSEIEKEVLTKVDLARQNMEEEVKLEIDMMRKFREGEEKKKMDEMNAKMAERERSLDAERKKLAEDRLAILENQMRIEKEKQKEKKKLEKKSKQEQMKILGKDKSRPKLSFSLMKN